MSEKLENTNVTETPENTTPATGKSEVSDAAKAAMFGLPMPRGANWRERTEYTAVKAITTAFQCGAISKETATEMRRSIIRNLDEAEKGYDFERKCWNRAGQMYRDTEAARCAYRKERTLENADKLIKAIDGVM